MKRLKFSLHFCSIPKSLWRPLSCAITIHGPCWEAVGEWSHQCGIHGLWLMIGPLQAKPHCSGPWTNFVSWVTMTCQPFRMQKLGHWVGCLYWQPCDVRMLGWHCSHMWSTICWCGLPSAFVLVHGTLKWIYFNSLDSVPRMILVDHETCAFRSKEASIKSSPNLQQHQKAIASNHEDCDVNASVWSRRRCIAHMCSMVTGSLLGNQEEWGPFWCTLVGMWVATGMKHVCVFW